MSVGSSVFCQLVSGVKTVWRQACIGCNAGVAFSPACVVKLLTPQQRIRPRLLHQQPQAFAGRGVVVEAGGIRRRRLDQAVAAHERAAAGAGEGDEVLPGSGVN